MSLEILEVSSEIVGKRLGQKLFNSKGNLLLGLGTEILSLHHSHIKAVGYRSVYVANGQPVDLDSIGHILSEKTLVKTPMIVKEIYNQLMSTKKIQVSDGKKRLNELADSLIKAVNTQLPHPPNLLDLKRQGDYLYQHAVNVAAYSILLGQRLQYHQIKLFDLAVAALVHDLGTMFIDPDLLNTPTELDEKEFEQIKQHTVLGFQHLGRKCFMKGLITIVALQHHERFDGSGYPSGLQGAKIHEYSQIVALSDLFDAYTSDRPYRRLHTIDEALDYIRDQSGKEFDPRIVKHFLSFFEQV